MCDLIIMKQRVPQQIRQEVAGNENIMQISRKAMHDDIIMQNGSCRENIMHMSLGVENDHMIPGQVSHCILNTA